MRTRATRPGWWAAASGAELELSLSPAAWSAVAPLAFRLAEASPERIWAEWARVLVCPRPAWGMERLRESGLLAAFAPELLEMVGVVQNRWHAYPVWEHSLLALAGTEPELPLRLAALLYDVGKPRCVSAGEDGERHFYRHEQVGADMAGGKEFAGEP